MLQKECDGRFRIIESFAWNIDAVFVPFNVDNQFQQYCHEVITKYTHDVEGLKRNQYHL